MEVNVCQADDRVDGTEGNKNTNTQISGRARLIFGVWVSRDHFSHGGGTIPISIDSVHLASAVSKLLQLVCWQHLSFTYAGKTTMQETFAYPIKNFS